MSEPRGLRSKGRSLLIRSFMKKYLYLARHSFVSTWVNGGIVPLSLSSKFLSEERSGTQTPDETKAYQSPIDLDSLHPYIKVGTALGMRIVGGTVNGQPMPSVYHASKYTAVGLILCFSNRFDRVIATKLKKAACVEIQDIDFLKTRLDDQLGVEGIMGACEYTDGYERGHFLKHKEDDWQDEFRIFWPIVKNNAEVMIPSSTGIELPFSPRIPDYELVSQPQVMVEEFTSDKVALIATCVIEQLACSKDNALQDSELIPAVGADLKIDWEKVKGVVDYLVDLNVLGWSCGIDRPLLYLLTEKGKSWKPKISDG